MRKTESLRFAESAFEPRKSTLGYQMETDSNNGWRKEGRTEYRTQALPPRRTKRYSLTTNQRETSDCIHNIGSFSWESDMQPSAETIGRASRLWIRHCEESDVVHGVKPTVTAADDNSLDIFWGDRRRRLLVNIPSGENNKILAHLIDPDGETIVYFSDKHTFNISNLLRELWRSLD